MQTADTSELSASAMLADLLAIIHGDGGHYQTLHGTKKAWEYAIILAAQGRAALSETPVQPEEPHCCVCGTTENLHKDGWYGYRCDSGDCVCF